jgi:bacteriorhodopsin
MSSPSATPSVAPNPALVDYWSPAPLAGYSYISNTGYIALWVAFAFMLFSAVTFLFLSYVRNIKQEARMVYYVTTIVNAIAALAYLTMALGGTEYSNPLFYRGFLWIRYVDWAFTVPLLLLDLGLLAGAHWVEVFFAVFCSLIMIFAGFAGAISLGVNATWPLFVFGFVAYFPVAVALVTSWRSTAYKHHVEIGKLYDVLAFGIVIIFAGYGIVWACAEGSAKMTVDQEVIVYACLDIAAKCVFGFVLLFSREAIARYGTFLGGINTGTDFDFPVPATVSASSASGYTAVPTKLVYGEHRDLGFSQLHAATGTAAIDKAAAVHAAEHAPLVVPVAVARSS